MCLRTHLKIVVKTCRTGSFDVVCFALYYLKLFRWAAVEYSPSPLHHLVERAKLSKQVYSNQVVLVVFTNMIGVLVVLLSSIYFLAMFNLLQLSVLFHRCDW